MAFEQPAVEFPADWSLNATQHRRPEVLPWHARHRRPGVVAAPGRRPGRRHDRPLGRRGRLLRRRRRGRRVHRRAEVHPRHAAGGVQQPGVVQHRRRRACRSRRRRASSSAVDDTMDSILNWYREEGIIFKGGSGAGINLSHDPLQRRADCNGGGTASGPVSFMRGADASAGTIKSGGKTRRAAKMVILDVDHPDIEEFVWCKADEERKARVLRDARLRHGPRRRRLVLDPVPERQQLGAGHRRVHAGGRRRRRLDAERRHHRRGVAHRAGPRPVAPDRRGGVGVRRPRPAVRHHDQPLAHRRSTGRINGSATRARSTSTSTTRRATWPRSTCSSSSTTTASTSTPSATRSRSCSRRRRSSSGGPTTRPRRSPRRATPSASSASATPTSGPC